MLLQSKSQNLLLMLSFFISGRLKQEGTLSLESTYILYMLLYQPLLLLISVSLCLFCP